MTDILLVLLLIAIFCAAGIIFYRLRKNNKARPGVMPLEDFEKLIHFIEHK